jgi:hypothetical protein
MNDICCCIDTSSLKFSYPRYDYDKNNNLVLVFDDKEEHKLSKDNDDGSLDHDIIFIGIRQPHKIWDYIKHCPSEYFNQNIEDYTSFMNKLKKAGLECRIFSSRQMCWTLYEINKILSITGYFNKLINETVEIARSNIIE